MKNNKLKKLQVLLGLVPQSFAYKTTEGVEMEIEGDGMEIGRKVYIITPEGELPAPDGEYEMEMGTKIKTMGGMIEEMEVLNPEQEIVNIPSDEEMTEATLVDGTKVTNKKDTGLEIGEKLYVITESGEMVDAPEGEHTTDSGIVVVVDADGIIQGIRQPDMAPEGSLEAKQEMSITEVVETFTSAIQSLNEKMNAMTEKVIEMDERFSKFSSQPAGDKIYDKKGFSTETPNTTTSKAEALIALRKQFNK